MKRVISTVAVFAACGLMLCVRAVSAAETGEKNSYQLAEAPHAASDVAAMRKDAKDKQEVVVVGRIGGRANPWIKGMAAFSIVDRSLKPCNEIEGDTCKTPWDYCCESDLGKSTLLVTFVDENGKIVKQDARKLLGVKELDTVTIVGRAKRDSSGNVSILASKVYIPTPDDKATQ
jgi:hypothetical protein